MAKSKIKKEDVIDTTIPENGMVWITANESSKHLKNGIDYFVTSTLAKTLIKKGVANLKQ